MLYLLCNIETGMFKVPNNPKIVTMQCILLSGLRFVPLFYLTSKISFHELKLNAKLII